MRNSASNSLACIIALTATSHAFSQTADANAVQSATAEIQQLVAAATEEFQDYHQITISDRFSTPIVLMQASSFNDAVPPTDNQVVESQIAEYYRGPGASYRSELSPRITSDEVAINPGDKYCTPGIIAYRNADGLLFTRMFFYKLAPYGDVLANHQLRQEKESRPGHTPSLSEGDFSPRFVFNQDGFPWADYFGKQLSEAEKVTRTETGDGLKYEFTGHWLKDEFKTHIEFHTYGTKKLPKGYEYAIPGKYQSSQRWEYVQQDGRWLPAKSILVMGTDTPGAVKFDVMTYTFSNTRASLTAEEVESGKPLTPEMEALFKRGMDLQIKKDAAEKGITPSGNIVETADNAPVPADTNIAVGK